MAHIAPCCSFFPIAATPSTWTCVHNFFKNLKPYWGPADKNVGVFSSRFMHYHLDMRRLQGNHNMFCVFTFFLQQQQQQKRYISPSKSWQLLNAQAYTQSVVWLVPTMTSRLHNSSAVCRQHNWLITRYRFYSLETKNQIRSFTNYFIPIS